MSGLLQRIIWIVTGRTTRPVVAFDWVRGRVGSRQNPDGMRSLMHAGLFLAFLCLVIDLWILWRHDWYLWGIFAFAHSAYLSAIIVLTALNVGFLETVDGEPLRGLGGPNFLTLSRGILIPSLAYLLLTRDFVLGVFFYAAISATDIVDGWWARHTGQQSKMGVVLDPIVDFQFHLVAFLCLGVVDVIGSAAMVLILVRSGLLVVGTGLLYFWRGQVRIQPTIFGKGSGLLLCLGTITLLGCAAFFPSTPEGTTLVRVLRGMITILLGLSVLHMIAIGVVNLGQPVPDTLREAAEE